MLQVDQQLSLVGLAQAYERGPGGPMVSRQGLQFLERHFGVQHEFRTVFRR